MTVRRRAQATSARAALVHAAVEMLQFDGYRVRAGGMDADRAAERRRLVERALTSAEVVMADRVLAGDDAVRAQLGPEPHPEVVLAAAGEILGRTPRMGD